MRGASAMPIELSLKRFPCGAMTSAPDFTHRLASGMSAVTTIAPGPARSAIQSSAASGPTPTTTRSIPGVRGIRIALFATTKNRQPIAGGDAVDLILNRTGVGVDKDTQLRSDRFHVGAVSDLFWRFKSASNDGIW